MISLLGALLLMCLVFFALYVTTSERRIRANADTDTAFLARTCAVGCVLVCAAVWFIGVMR